MTATHTTTETGATMVAKATPPVSVSLAKLAGYDVSELLMWATLIYTILLIVHKVYVFGVDIRRNHATDRRCNAPDTRKVKINRRK